MKNQIRNSNLPRSPLARSSEKKKSSSQANPKEPTKDFSATLTLLQPWQENLRPNSPPRRKSINHPQSASAPTRERTEDRKFRPPGQRSCAPSSHGRHRTSVKAKRETQRTWRLPEKMRAHTTASTAMAQYVPPPYLPSRTRNALGRGETTRAGQAGAATDAKCQERHHFRFKRLHPTSQIPPP